MGVEQSITSAYNPQSNGLSGRRNWTISLIKVLKEKDQWPYVIDGVLFAHES